MMRLIKRLSEPRALLLIGIVYTLLITVIFFSPAQNLHDFQVVAIDKIAHFCIHLGLTIIWLFFFYSNGRQNISLRTIIIILALCICYGIIVEVLQKQFAHTRQAELLDIVANIIGTFFGFALFWKTKRLIKI